MNRLINILSTFFVGTSITVSGAYADPPQAPRSIDQLKATVERATQQITKGASASRVSWRLDRVGPSLILKIKSPLTGETPRAQADDFVNRYAALWGRAEVKVTEVTERAGRAVATLTARVEGLPLLGQQSRLSIKEGHAQHLSNGIGAVEELIRAEIDGARASAAALKAMSGGEVASVKRAALPFEPGRALEVYEVRVVDRIRLRSWVVLVDGRDGAVSQIRDGEVR